MSNEKSKTRLLRRQPGDVVREHEAPFSGVFLRPVHHTPLARSAISMTAFEIPSPAPTSSVTLNKIKKYPPNTTTHKPRIQKSRSRFSCIVLDSGTSQLRHDDINQLVKVVKANEALNLLSSSKLGSTIGSTKILSCVCARPRARGDASLFASGFQTDGLGRVACTVS